MNNKNHGSLRIISLISSVILAALSLVFLTLFITDRFNTSMAFVNHNYTKALALAALLVFALTALTALAARLAGPVIRVFMQLTAFLEVALLVLILVDRYVPSAILFTKDPVKFTFAAVAVFGLVTALMLQIKNAGNKGTNEETDEEP